MRERGLTGERGKQDRGKGWWREGGGSGVCVVPGSKGMECCSDVTAAGGGMPNNDTIPSSPCPSPHNSMFHLPPGGRETGTLSSRCSSYD